MKGLERRLQAAEDRLTRMHLAALPNLYVQYVAHEDLRPFGASSLEQAQYTALIDRTNAHVQELVNLHGLGILRDHSCRNDAYGVLSTDDLEFIEHMIVTYRLGGRTEEAA